MSLEGMAKLIIALSSLIAVSSWILFRSVLVPIAMVSSAAYGAVLLAYTRGS